MGGGVVVGLFFFFFFFFFPQLELWGYHIGEIFAYMTGSYTPICVMALNEKDSGKDEEDGPLGQNAETKNNGGQKSKGGDG